MDWLQKGGWGSNLGTGKFFLEPDFFRTGAKYLLRTGVSNFFLEPETAKFPQVINMAKIGRTEMLYPVPGSIFAEFSHSDDHFAIALQKTSVFAENQYF